MNTKFGYYEIGDKKTLSKIEAIELHNKTGIHPRWNFNDAIFSSYDWTQEPEESLAELYRQRAQQLREKYDYIVLFFSGGADSTNVLHSFLHNNIHINEIVSYHQMSVAGVNGWCEKEYLLAAKPAVHRALEINPNIRFRELDIAEYTLDYYRKKHNRLEAMYHLNDLWSPHHFGLSDLANGIADWQNLADSGKKVCLLHGLDKPRVSCHENRYLMRFLDVLISSSIDVKILQQATPAVEHEPFYWTADFPKLLIKQGHVIKRYLETALPTSFGITTSETSVGGKEINGQRLWLTSTGLHALIYPTWDLNTYQNPKHLSPVASPRDNWFFQNPNSDEFRVYKMTLQAIKQTLGDYWTNDPQNITRSVKGMWSNSYYLN